MVETEQTMVTGLRCPEVETMGVAEFLRLISLPGEHREIRVLHGETTLTKAPRTFSGVFSLASIETMATTLARQPWTRYGGIYVTMNPLAPAYRRPQESPSGSLAMGGTCAKDKDMLCRRWLLVDLDAKRVRAHDPASPEEHAATVERARTIWTTLTAEGWGKPLVIDSGNGVQMFWRIDLPTQDGGLVKRVLQGFDRRFSDAQVAVDLSVHNAARLCRVAGTWNIKGCEVPEQARHYRLARILAAPQALEVVPREVLDAMAATPPRAPLQEELPKATPVTGATTEQLFMTRRFEIDAFMAAHFPEAQAMPYEGGRKWVLKVCPFNPEHDNSAAVVVERPDGSLGFVCHHNGCQGHDWHALRAKFDAAYAQRLNQASAPTQRPAVAPTVAPTVTPMASAPRISADGGMDELNLETIVEPPAFIQGMEFPDLLKAFPKLRPELLHGLLRVGEVMNVIAAPKTGKSWLAMQLAAAIAMGTPWLGRTCEQRRVLYFDNELHDETCAYRMGRIAQHMGVEPETLRGRLRVSTLRGNLMNIKKLLLRHAAWYKAQGFGVIVVDALYRALPEDCDENSNQDMTQLYNMLDLFAKATDISIIIVHHTSKGDQSEKRVTDIGSGAGTVARAADTHLVILPHPEMEECALVQVASRSFKEQPSWCLRRIEGIWIPATPPNGQALPVPQAPAPTTDGVVEVLRTLGGSALKSQLLAAVRDSCACRGATAQETIERAIREGKVKIRETIGKNHAKAKLCTLPEAPQQEELTAEEEPLLW